jgi:putative acetyltransferase
MSSSQSEPAPIHVDGVTIRAQRPGDRASVRDVIVRAFERNVVADLAESLRDAPAGAAGLSFVAEQAAERAAEQAAEQAAEGPGEVVGHVQLSRSWLDAPERLVEVLVLSPLSVAPEQQRHGIGGRLVRHALSEATRVGAPMVFLEGSPAYYSRLGFATASRRGFTAPSVRIPDAGFQVAILPSYAPWMTGALVYA